jgi:hypothetical protein
VAEIERLGGNGNRARERRLTVRLQHIDLAYDAPGGVRARRLLALAVGPGRRRARDCARAQPPAAGWRERGGLLNSRHGVFAEAHAGHRARGIEDDHGVGFAPRRIGAWRHGGRGSLDAEEEGACGAQCKDDRPAFAHHRPQQAPLATSLFLSSKLDAFRESRSRRGCGQAAQRVSAPPDGAEVQVPIRAFALSRAEPDMGAVLPNIFGCCRVASRRPGRHFCLNLVLPFVILRCSIRFVTRDEPKGHRISPAAWQKR